ncbi:MAG: cache domain-containing protein [Smithellaceae bacterium]|nr:cache domain-containing protein [Smithellaceae bacterium]
MIVSYYISFPWKSFLVRVVLPTVLTVVLFISAIIFLIVPTIEKNSLDRKREMIRELTHSAWNILAKLENDERQGLLTRKQAQSQAIDQISNLHYGQSEKDYFWINDMNHRIVIHPFRKDLIGSDLSDYKDPDGKRVFVDIVNIVKEKGSGYLEYQWQSYGNVDLVLPKISYVKGFTPWSWIVGTGIYIEDVKSEMQELTAKVVKISLVILLLMLLLLGSIISQSYQTHKKQREAEDELKKTQSSLFLSEKLASLGRLSAMVAHEINNPLSGILSYAKLSTRYLGQETISAETIASTRENLSFIALEAKRCGDIVKNLLLFAKRSMGEVKEAHMNEIIDVSAKVIDHSARMKELDLISELDSGDDLIECDAGAIQQILVALIVNAMEASPKGQKIIIRTEYQDKATLRFKIIDFGAGIPRDVLPYIFDPFFSTKECDSKSLGLGLSAVYGIVQHHKGTITVDSVVGRGTEFTITLPRTQKQHSRQETH